MNILDWLNKGNPNIKYLVSKYLENEAVIQENNGYIKMYLNEYNHNTKMFGKGLYGPKWISTTYTLLDLINLEVNVTPSMIEAYNLLRTEIVKKYTLNPLDKRTQDLCIVGMLLKMGSYIEVNEDSHKELIDFILYTINDDGAWNCYYNYREYKTSSLHTTINILEGLAMYKEKGYTYRLKEVEEVIESSEEFILKKKLFRSRRTNNIIHKDFTEVHYPTRWRYDLFRTMDYFVNVKKPYDDRMDEALVSIKNHLLKGKVVKGKTYTGKHHFILDLEDYKRINTFRLLKVIKFYDCEFYESIIKKEI